MAAEDYFPSPFEDFDAEEQREYSSWSSQRLFITCKRCGEEGLHWVQTGQGWRLFDGDHMHTCVKSAKATTFPANALSSLVSSTTNQQYTPLSKEPIMDKNAVAFIRNDVRTLTVAFIDTEKGSSEEYSAEALRQRVMPYQKYTYLTIDPSIQAGDLALVDVEGIIKAVYVVTASDELDIEPNAAVTYRFVVGRVELSSYRTLMEQNSKIHDMLRTSYKETTRAGFRQALLSGLPEDKQASLSIILSKEQ